MSGSTDATTSTARAAAGIDPRGPRFGAGITAILALVVVALGLSGATVAALVVLAWMTLAFLWGATAGIRRHPYGLLYRSTLRRALRPPTELEDPAPPTFAQGVGFVITVIGLVLGLVGVTAAVPVAAALAFLAAFLNSVFGYCLGCQIYLLLVRAGLIRRRTATVA